MNEDVEKVDLGVDVPEIPLEDFEAPDAKLDTALNLVNSYTGSIDFGIVGSGQCGGRLAKSFHTIGYNKTIAVNTAKADLSPLDLPLAQKLLIGSVEGSGKSMLKGFRATDSASQKIFDLMRDVFGTVDKIVLCAGFGGGTGAGSLEVLIDISVKYMKFLGKKNPEKDIILVAALPTAGELNSHVVRSNVAAIEKAMFTRSKDGMLGPIILIDNSKIEKLYRGIPPKVFWSTINDTITGLFHMFNFLSKQSSEYTSFDAEDYRTVLSASGVSVLGVAKVVAEDYSQVKLAQALQDNFKKTLLSDVAKFSTAKEAACIVLADDAVLSSLSMDVINYGIDSISNLIASANVHRGLYGSKKVGIRTYTLISGMEAIIDGDKQL